MRWAGFIEVGSGFGKCNAGQIKPLTTRQGKTLMLFNATSYLNTNGTQEIKRKTGRRGKRRGWKMTARNWEAGGAWGNRDGRVQRYIFCFWRTRSTAAPPGWVSRCCGNTGTEVTWLSLGECPRVCVFSCTAMRVRRCWPTGLIFRKERTCLSVYISWWSYLGYRTLEVLIHCSNLV